MSGRTRWERVKDLFDRASAVAGAERDALLAAECGADAELRAEVESLLAAGDAAPDLFEKPAVSFMPELLTASPDGLKPGDEIGPYRLAERIGVGGMGAVWRAAHAARPDEPVAVKVLWQGAETPDILRRFANERHSLASLRHPNIARLLDGGLSAQGRPYLVMEYVAGAPLDRWCDERRLPTEKRLEILRAVCEGVHFAHRNLIVHRDLKPDNVLIAGDGEPKLLDFGIAKILGPADGPASVTLTELRAMTPQYASPEQVGGGTVTTASDVYSLGVIAYELLTGRRPYRVPAVVGIEAQRVISETEPPRPSAVVLREPAPEDLKTAVPGGAAELAERRGLRPEALARLLAGDLDKIVLMAMRKDPTRRYASAGHLAEEIRRFLHGLPVEAQDDTFGYRLRKFVRRNRLMVAAGGLVFLSLVGGVLGTAWQARAASRQAEFARSEADSLHRVVDFMTGIYEAAASRRDRGEPADAIAMLEESTARIRGELSAYPRERAALLGAMGQAYTLLGRLGEAEDMLQESLDLRRGIYPARHPEMAESFLRMAALRHAQDRAAEAEALARDALRLWREAWGDDRVDIAHAHALLGELLAARGAHDEAGQHLREALRILELHEFGPEHPQMRRVREMIGATERG